MCSALWRRSFEFFFDCCVVSKKNGFSLCPSCFGGKVKEQAVQLQQFPRSWATVVSVTWFQSSESDRARGRGIVVIFHVVLPIRLTRDVEPFWFKLSGFTRRCGAPAAWSFLAFSLHTTCSSSSSSSGLEHHNGVGGRSMEFTTMPNQ